MPANLLHNEEVAKHTKKLYDNSTPACISSALLSLEISNV
jgi:hypothetical protein